MITLLERADDVAACRAAVEARRPFDVVAVISIGGARRREIYHRFGFRDRCQRRASAPAPHADAIARAIWASRRR